MKTLHDAQMERYAGLLRAARRVVSANQESQPSEYHSAMIELEKIVSHGDSPLDTQPGSDQCRGQMELLAALRELVREIEENCCETKTRTIESLDRDDGLVCSAITFNNAKAAIQAATMK